MSNTTSRITAAALTSFVPDTWAKAARVMLFVLFTLLLVLPSATEAASPNATINSVRWEERNSRLIFHVDLNVRDMQYVDTKVLVWFKYTHNNAWVKRGGNYVMIRREIRPRYGNSHWSDLTLSIPTSSIPRTLTANTIKPHIEVRRTADDLTIGRWESNSMRIRFNIRGSVHLYEGNGGRQNLVCSIPFDGNLKIVNFKNDNLSCENDEARSLVLQNIPAGTNIYVYDSSSCSRYADDATEIRVKRNIDRYVVSTFERSYENSLVDVNYLTAGNLDGKVSCVKIVP